MKGPTIYVVVNGHVDFHYHRYIAWFFDKDEAREFADKQPRSDYSGCSVEEVPCGSPMTDKVRW